MAESCTGGGLAAAITDCAGSSQWFDRGFITYSNQAKQDMLGVSNDILSTYGAVSEETVRAMAEGALQASGSQVTVSISGIAGPGGGSLEKPVGTVWIAWACIAHPIRTQSYVFKGNRTDIRNQAIYEALRGLLLT